MWTIQFSERRSLRCLAEDAPVDPGAPGFELAARLSRALVVRGIVSSSYIAFDDPFSFVKHFAVAKQDGA
ncbi:MAG: hypothetical protein SGJ21_07470 [Alphaproteobacteria bacterium]|nr:hypothetical protein [Alphaproteobacteria bacterium]